MSKNKKSGKKKVVVTQSNQSNKRVVTAKKVETKKSKKISPTTSRIKSKGGSSASLAQADFIFERKNYLLMLGGIGLMAIGFLLMLGGHMPSPDVWEPERIYSFRRITLAPICILAGLGLEVYAIFKKF